MKTKFILFLFITGAIFISCTPDIEDDYLNIKFSRSNKCQSFNSGALNIVFAKAVYNGELSRNGVFVDSVSYSENALLKYNGITSYKYSVYPCVLSTDSNLYAVKCDTSQIYFRKISIIDQSSLIYGDTLFRIAFNNPETTDTILSFDSAAFTQALPFMNDSTEAYIDSLNNSAKWYKTYRQWQDEIINLNR
ncbi:MAG TPA: hypothetical protein PLK90_06905 [Clostridiales bacterium]|nr:hypothetical protein [Clostridiales bacterium]HQP70112.1 hypothetical protein [Clostridiales bacterium]